MRINPALLRVLLIITFLLCDLINVYAVGALFSRPRWSDQEYQKMWIKTVNASINIDEQIAVTHLDQVFFNELNQSVEAIFIFPLPENATITELVYWVNGQRFVAQIRERQDAINAYNEKLRQWLDPALLEYLGNNLFRLSIVPIDGLSEVRTEITYMEPLKYDFGFVDYSFQLNTLELSSRPLESVTIDLDAKSKFPFKSFTSPSHSTSTALNISALAVNHYRLFYGDENFSPDKDLHVQYSTRREEIDFTTITYTPSDQDSIGKDSFFALWITSPDEVSNAEILPQSIVFTADVSSSMEGKRIEQVKTAMNSFIDLLNSQDRFNILTFGTFVEKFKPDLVDANEANKDSARKYISALYALGLTNIDDALTSSLQQTYGEQTDNNLIFLTDGEPTWGETSGDIIVNHTKSNNTENVKIFTFGVGEDLTEPLLEKISAENQGFATFISNDDSISLVVNNLFRRISKPVLTNISIDLGGLAFWDSYPKVVSNLFWGSQILYLGKYSNSGTFNVTLNGTIAGGGFNYSYAIDFSEAPGGGHNFVPRLWAREKINHLMGLISTYGENEELINQVIELSLMFQILTPYTAFYVDPVATDVDDENTMVTNFRLLQNYPNPFNPSTTIAYELPFGKSSYSVILKIYNSLGQLVRVLVSTQQPSGIYSLQWDGKDLSGRDVPSGVYLYTLSVDNLRISRKMMLLR